MNNLEEDLKKLDNLMNIIRSKIETSLKLVTFASEQEIDTSADIYLTLVKDYLSDALKIIGEPKGE